MSRNTKVTLLAVAIIAVIIAGLFHYSYQAEKAFKAKVQAAEDKFVADVVGVVKTETEAIVLNMLAIQSVKKAFVQNNNELAIVLCNSYKRASTSIETSNDRVQKLLDMNIATMETTKRTIEACSAHKNFTLEMKLLMNFEKTLTAYKDALEQLKKTPDKEEAMRV